MELLVQDKPGIDKRYRVVRTKCGGDGFRDAAFGQLGNTVSDCRWRWGSAAARRADERDPVISLPRGDSEIRKTLPQATLASLREWRTR